MGRSGTADIVRKKAVLKLANDVTGREQWWSLTAVKMRLICYEITQYNQPLAASSSDWVWSNKSHSALGQIMARRHDGCRAAYTGLWVISYRAWCSKMQNTLTQIYLAAPCSTSGWSVHTQGSSKYCWTWQSSPNFSFEGTHSSLQQRIKT